MVYNVRQEDHMICPTCNAPMVHSGDEDLEDDDSLYSMVSFHNCNECGTEVNIYRPRKLDEEN